MDIAITSVSGDGKTYNSGTEPTGAPRKAAPVPAATGKGGAVNSEAVKKMVEEIQRNIDSMDVALRFSTYGKNQEKIAIAITDRDTGKVIREIPPKELQDLYMKMNELAGMIFNNIA